MHLPRISLAITGDDAALARICSLITMANDTRDLPHDIGQMTVVAGLRSMAKPYVIDSLAEGVLRIHSEGVPGDHIALSSAIIGDMTKILIAVITELYRTHPGYDPSYHDVRLLAGIKEQHPPIDLPF